MGWTLDFLRDRLLSWIQDQGGWVRGLGTHGPSCRPTLSPRRSLVKRFLACVVNPSQLCCSLPPTPTFLVQYIPVCPCDTLHPQVEPSIPRPLSRPGSGLPCS